MKRMTLSEGLSNGAFLLYLVGSSMAHTEGGSELTLWIMTLAIFVTFCITVLPWLGFGWLRLARPGQTTHRWLALGLRILSWITYTLSMGFRLQPNLPQFHTSLTITTLLWAAWMLIYTRHSGNTPESAAVPAPPDSPKNDTMPLSNPEKRGTDEECI